MKNKPKILIYDIETTPIRFWGWQLGKQVVRHHQIDPDDPYGMFDIISIAYQWADEKEAKVMCWDPETQDSSKMVEAFDKIIQQADVTIGKNSDKFDVKKINTSRLMHDLEPLPYWVECTDDVEKQLRRFFKFPSYSLDYISKLFGFGGKDKMEFDDWLIIRQKKYGYKARLKKMMMYNKKDVEDTLRVWRKIEKHVKPRYNYSILNNITCCKFCGSKRIRSNGSVMSGVRKLHKFYCTEHRGYAGNLTETQFHKYKDGKPVKMR